MTSENVAAIAHAANRQFCELVGDPIPEPWETASDHQKESVHDGVMLLMEKPETTSEQSHANWSAFKRAEGWLYGPTKDEGLKTHPNLVEYFELSDVQKAKDSLFIGICLALRPLVMQAEKELIEPDQQVPPAFSGTPGDNIVGEEPVALPPANDGPNDAPEN